MMITSEAFNNFNNTFTLLGEGFYTETLPTAVSNPKIFAINHKLSKLMGLEALVKDQSLATDFFSGNLSIENPHPIAMVYAGHQFGQFNPQLGDGRAVFLGSIDFNDQHFELQLKGSGPTVFSRRGDGRSALGPVIREYLVSEAMNSLNIPTTRALAATSSGDYVMREGPVPGGVFTRVATSYIRVGTFQYFYANNKIDSVKKLADYTIDNYFNSLSEDPNPYKALLSEVINRQAQLIAKWMSVGFIHGVMNTDNMSIVGETIDYGPCAFMDDFSYDKVFSYIDQQGRYAYNNQPSIGLWNLTRLAESLLPLLSDDEDQAVEIAERALEQYAGLYDEYWLQAMKTKLGISGSENNDRSLIKELLDLMNLNNVDFTLCFYWLSHADHSSENNQFIDLFSDKELVNLWRQKWLLRLGSDNTLDQNAVSLASIQLMRTVNPVIIPRNHQIESCIRAAEDHSNFEPFEALNAALQNPFNEKFSSTDYFQPPKKDEIITQTFCGT